MKFILEDASGQISVVTAPSVAAGLLQRRSGETLYQADENLPYIDDSKLEVVDNRLVRKFGVAAPVSGDGLEVLPIE